MATIRAFNCIRPNEKVADKVAALPYDVYDRIGAKKAVRDNPLSFLNIDRPETQFSSDIDMYSDIVYQKAKDMLDDMISDGTFIEDHDKCLFIYEQTVGDDSILDMLHGMSQTGIVCCASIDEYMSGIIKKHENTREEKERDRIRHIDICSAQTGPIFLAYRDDEHIDTIVNNIKKDKPIYDFISDDGIKHRIWRISDKKVIDILCDNFKNISNLYIADGHHRAASAVKVGIDRRNKDNDFDKDKEYNYFLSIIFPDKDLHILPYNRAIKDLHGLTTDDFIKKISEIFEIKKIDDISYKLAEPHRIGMYISSSWYELISKDIPIDPVSSLDVSILQDRILSPILGIEDPRTDNRISFVGGIKGNDELMKMVDSKAYAVAFSMYPTSMNQLFNVADKNLLMPPKSTWFEPKLRSGLFIHHI